jgi:alkylation response protein AidB-like acyl-CoA dehydrogenase
MDFNLSEEQAMLADAVNRWLNADYDLDARREWVATPAGFCEQNWRQLAQLGLLGLNVPEEYGGIGAGATESSIVMQAFGRALLAEPYISTAVMTVAALSGYGSEEQRLAFLPGIAAGEIRFAVAALEAGVRYDLAQVASTVTAAGDGYRLTGRKAVVLDGGAAHHLLVTARMTGSGGKPGELCVFIVGTGLAGVTVESFPTIDGLRCAEIQFNQVPLAAHAMLGAPGQGFEVIECAIGRGIAALCAEAVGAIDRLNELTAEYLKSRRQFGQPIASFQALQHRMADMLTAAEQARSMAYLAAARVSDPDLEARRKALSAAKTLIGQTGRFVGEQAVQLHGGMGMTDELAVGHYFKRLVRIDLSFGDSAYHLQRYGETL